MRPTPNCVIPTMRVEPEQFPPPVTDLLPVTGAREAFPDRLPGHSETRSGQLNWFAIRVRSGAEARVRDSLRSSGTEEFLPTFTETIRWSDRTKVTIRPLFPNYLFARFDRGTEAASVLSISGVLQILGHDEIDSISADEIANLRIVCASPLAEAVAYVAGTSRVRVKTGPFAGVEGVVSRVKGGTVLSIPVQILGRSVSVQIDAADVEACK